LLGKRIIVEHEEDAGLIGGVMVRVGDNTFDGSIRGRLEELERQLLATA
jgi:F-type H+-transporting ATPase subunit delta